MIFTSGVAKPVFYGVRFRVFPFVCFACLVCACTPKDKAYINTQANTLGAASGAVLGATSGAVTGAQIGSATGHGALIGAGLGAVSGASSGYSQVETQRLQSQNETELKELKGRANAQAILRQHYDRRVALHPTRDIYPADLFFDNDSVLPRDGADYLIEELARLSISRQVWSRILIKSYITSKSGETEYARYLSEARAKVIANGFIRVGVEPRRVFFDTVFLTRPILVDPLDDEERYNTAFELVLID